MKKRMDRDNDVSVFKGMTVFDIKARDIFKDELFYFQNMSFSQYE